MDVGVDGILRRVTDRTLLFPQVLPELTDKVPLTKAAPKVILILFVPCPELTIVPAGNVQLWVVAPVTSGQLYVWVLPAHTPRKVPAIEAGVPGLLAMASVLLVLVPATQLDAFTLSVPDAKEALKLTVALEALRCIR